MSFETRLVEWRENLTGDFIPAEEANKFVTMMRGEHPDELDEWLTVRAVAFCTERLGKVLRVERSKSLKRSKARAFAEATAGDLEDVSPFRVVYRIDESNTRRPVAKMTGGDHLFVAETYKTTGKRHLLLSEFHRAVARKVKDKRTSDVFSEDEYAALRDSILSGVKATKAVAVLPCRCERPSPFADDGEERCAKCGKPMPKVPVAA